MSATGMAAPETSAPRMHPRPILARTGWVDLDGPWELRFDDDDRGVDERWGVQGVPFDRSIVVPYPPESELSGVAEDGHAVVWYRRDVELRRPAGGLRTLLHFEAVDYRADVWVNGVHVGSHEGGHVGFHFDVTHALVDGDRQRVVVRAFDDPTSLEQPRGKQDWEPTPHVIWYRRTTGIWRQVWAETVAAAHLDQVRWTAGDRPGTLTLDATVAGARGVADLELEVGFALDGAHLAGSRHVVTDGRLTATFELRDPRFDTEQERLLWSPESPTLVDVELTLRRRGEPVDRATSYVGLRTVASDGRHFLLNARPYYLRLVLEQAYWPQSHLAAPDDDAIRREVELVKSLGFNGVRMHQTVADPRFLYWCDRLGLLVWADAPAAYRFSSLALGRTAREWMEIVARDASHPSIVTWVAFNESWGVPGLAVDETQRSAVAGMTALIKALDPSRLVIGNDGWEYVAGDLVGIHDYTHSDLVLEERYGTRQAVDATIDSARPGGRVLDLTRDRESLGRAVVLSEFGGIGLSSDDGAWDGYGAAPDAATFVAQLGRLLAAVSASDALAGFCYTQLTDTLQETNGLADAARVPKASVDDIRELVLWSPKVGMH